MLNSASLLQRFLAALGMTGATYVCCRFLAALGMTGANYVCCRFLAALGMTGAAYVGCRFLVMTGGNARNDSQANNKNTVGFLCRSGGDCFHSDTGLVFTHSFSEVSSTATHNIVPGLHIFTIVSNN